LGAPETCLSDTLTAKLKLTLKELGHPHQPIPIHCDNATAVGISNGTVKQQRLRSMEMRHFYVCDQVRRKIYDVQYHPGLENLSDYNSKHFEVGHHLKVRPVYVHTCNSPYISHGQ